MTTKETSRATPRVSYLVKWVERGIRSQLDAALGPLQVSTPEYTTLSVLRARSGLSSAQLARRAFVSGQAMNQIVIALERRGWIARTPDPLHGKILRAQLTRKGVEIVRACDQATASVERALLEDLTPARATALRKALETCAAALARAGERRRPVRSASAQRSPRTASPRTAGARGSASGARAQKSSGKPT